MMQAVPTNNGGPSRFDRLVAFIRPFTHVGIDYFGPLEVAIGRTIEQRWGTLATCMTTRAVLTHVQFETTLIQP